MQQEIGYFLMVRYYHKNQTEDEVSDIEKKGTSLPRTLSERIRDQRSRQVTMESWNNNSYSHGII